MKTNSKLFHASLCASLLLPSIASAQEADAPLPAPPPRPELAPPADAAPPPMPVYDGAVVLDLAGDEKLTITVYAVRDGIDPSRALFSCQTPCRVRILPGKYRFHVRGGSDKIEADRVVEVRGHEELRFSLPERSAKSEALTMAITGTALVPIGFLVMFASAWSNSCFDCGSQEQRDRSTPAGVYVGLGMLVAGAIMTPVGWVAFAKNRKPRFEETPLSGSAPAREARKRTPPRIGFGVAPARGGASAALWGSF